MSTDRSIFSRLCKTTEASSEKNILLGVLESLLSSARTLSHADGGTVYLLDEKEQLHFFIIQNNSLNLYGEKIPTALQDFAHVQLNEGCGQAKNESVASIAVTQNKIINVEDIYHSTEYPCTGAKNFDPIMHYKTQSLLAIPIHNNSDEVIGVLQLVNHTVANSNKISAFNTTDVDIAKTLADQMGMHIDMQLENCKLVNRIAKLNQIALALSSAHNLEQMLEKILDHAKELTSADGGTLYLNHDGKLHFEVMRTSSLNIHLSHAAGNMVNLMPIDIYAEDGQPNDHVLAANVAAHRKSINIPDVYQNKQFNFTKVKAFDQDRDYRTLSMLTVPLINQQGDLVGVLQLINSTSDDTGKIQAFSSVSQELAESLAALAAVAINNKRLNDELQILIESFISVISKAIDEKSSYTGGHCRRVPELALMLAQAASDHSMGEMADFKLNAEKMYEMKIAAMLHDCGKITTPIHIVDKSTKLERICDRVDLIALRYEIKRRDVLISYLLKHSGLSDQAAHKAVQPLWDQLNDDLVFLRSCNTGGEFMEAEKQGRVRAIAASATWIDANNNMQPLLSEDEVYNLNICKGTLNQEDRNIINYHITATINMLEALPFPKHLKDVAEIAGGHHERMDGKGYPKGLTREEMSVQARVMGIADVFEALTASDRPYKKGMPLTLAMSIMENMQKEGHIDPELFEIFKQHRIHIHYAHEFLDKNQIDMD